MSASQPTTSNLWCRRLECTLQHRPPTSGLCCWSDLPAPARRPCCNISIETDRPRVNTNLAVSPRLLDVTLARRASALLGRRPAQLTAESVQLPADLSDGTRGARAQDQVGSHGLCPFDGELDRRR